MAAAPQRRSYRSPVRERRARETRRRILEAAADGFATAGFAGTTLAGIAARASVSVDSVVAVGSKAFLLLESFRLRYAGEGGWRSVLDESSVQQMFTITDPDDGMGAAVEWLAAGHARSADLWFVVRATALFEPVVAEGLDELMALKQESFAATADWLVDIGAVARPADADRRALATALNLLMSAETYAVLTRDWRYSEQEYRQWLRRMLPQLRA